MSLNAEITRIENAKTTLKTKLNARNDNQHQIDDETIDEYGDFVDSIPQGGGGRDWSEIGYSSEPDTIQIGINYAKQIMQNWDSSVTVLSSKFSQDKELIFMPLVETSNSEYFKNMFSSCTSLITVPQLNTSNCIQCDSMFNGCSALITVSQLDMSHCERIGGIFGGCYALVSFGGFINLGQAYSTTASANYARYTLELNICTLLTHDSLMNVINNLYDIATKGCNAQQLVLGATNLAKLTSAEISTCTSKGWSVS